MRPFIPAALLLFAAMVTAQPLERATQTFTTERVECQIQLPKGLVLERMIPDLDAPRMLHFGPGGELFMGSRHGHVYRARPPYREAESLLLLHDYPHSVVVRDDRLYIAQTSGLWRIPYAVGQERLDEDDLERVAALPGGGGHNSRTLMLGPDRRLYVSLGITGNCSDEYLGEGYAFDDRRGGVLVLDETRSPPRWRPFAAGLRNPVGFAWRPDTGVAYAANNGPDHWGYRQPREVFARLDPGSYHGMPWFQTIGGKPQRDACIASDPPRPQTDITPPVAAFDARSAPMGVAFVPEGALIPALEGDAIVALHGSWATQPLGGFFGDPATRRPPKLVRVRFRDGQAATTEDLLTGLQDADGHRWIRPVGVAFDPRGDLYFSSDGGLEGLFRIRLSP